MVWVAGTEMVFSCEGFEQRDADPQAALDAFEAGLRRQPDFLAALKHAAFLLERDVVRRDEAEPYWKRIAELEKGR